MVERGSKIPESRPFSEKIENLIEEKAKTFNQLAEIKSQIESLQQNPENASTVEKLKKEKEELEKKLMELKKEIEEVRGEKLN